MLLRSVTKHVKDQNWFAVFIDFIIVVVGILIAFQITEWNETRQDRAIEQDYKVLLIEDLTTIKDELVQQIEHEEFIIKHAARSLKILNNLSTQPQTDLFGQTLTLITGRRTLKLESPTFTEIKGAGRLTVIQNTALRKEIITYFDDLSRSVTVVQKNNDYFVESFTAFLKNIGIGIIPLNQESCDPNANNMPCKFSQYFQAAMNGEKTDSAELILNAPFDDSIWIQFRSHISYRAMGAVSNLQRSKKTLKETEELSKKLENK
jgi:hypothetical protein